MKNEQETTEKTAKLALWKKIVFSIIPLLFLLFSAEIFLRFFPVYKPIAGATRSGYVIADKDLTWRLNPNVKGYRAPNREGFRDFPYKPDANIKVLLLGDSISWGDLVPHTEDIYPQVCEKLLTKETGATFEIINTGVPGYSTLQELKFLQLYGKKYKPDVVVLQFCLNDVVDRFRTMAAYGGDSNFLGVDTRAACRGFASLSQYSKIVETVVRYKQREGRNYQEYEVKNLVKTPLSEEIKYAWQLIFKELKEMKSVAKSLNAEFVILIAPYKFQLAGKKSDLLPQKMLIDFAEKNSIDYIDLFPDFAANKDKELYADANHFEIEGHKVAAAKLADFLKKKLNYKLKNIKK
jgi:lysophospholipase L1-like esterase